SLMSTGCQGGYYAIIFWVPRFLTTERKLSIVSSTGYLSALIVCSFIGYLVGAWLADRIGRRNLFLIFSLGAIAVVLLYTQLQLTNELLWVLGFPLGFFWVGCFSGVVGCGAPRAGFSGRVIFPVSARSSPNFTRQDFAAPARASATMSAAASVR